LGWMFQILPYLEEGAIAGICQQDQLKINPIPLYNCPSRRGVTYATPPGGAIGASLVDYAAVTAGPARSEPNKKDSNYDNYLNYFVNHQVEAFWGCPGCTEPGGGRGGTELKDNPNPQPKCRGVIQRGDWIVTAYPGPGYHAGYMSKMTDAKITDGTSK